MRWSLFAEKKLPVEELTRMARIMCTLSPVQSVPTTFFWRHPIFSNVADGYCVNEEELQHLAAILHIEGLLGQTLLCVLCSQRTFTASAANETFCYHLLFADVQLRRPLYLWRSIHNSDSFKTVDGVADKNAAEYVSDLAILI